MGEQRGDRYWEGETCPMCLRWHCLDCGFPFTQTTQVLTAPPVKVCTRCRSTHGEYRSVIHRDELVTKTHRAQFEAREKVIPYNREQIRDLMALVDFLTPMIRNYATLNRRALHTATDSPDNNEAINNGNKILLGIDDLVRSWVRSHPATMYDPKHDA